MSTAFDLRTLRLPRELMAGRSDVASELIGFIDDTVNSWTATKVLSAKDGYGFATTNVLPVGSLMNVHWDDPKALLGFGIAEDRAPTYYVWNALRKMRMLARARQAGYDVASSLELAALRPGFSRDAITDEERAVEKTGGLIRWGDFPYGGAVYRSNGAWEVMLGFSIWTQQEDHRVAGATADRLLELANLVG